MSTWILHCTETCFCCAPTFLPAPLPPALIFTKEWEADAGHSGDRGWFCHVRALQQRKRLPSSP